MTKNHKKIITFKLLGILLSYPEALWVSELAYLISTIKEENVLRHELYQGLDQFLQYCQTQDLLEIQEHYVFLFDQNRALSLHLFEHVHGESRDRGQAMVDLLEMYKTHGVEIDKNELPDYLPLFLEFLSILPNEESCGLLKDAMPIVKGIAKNLAERGSEYALIFNCLLFLGGELTLTLSTRKKEHDVQALSEKLDREWEEEEVKFLANQFDSTCTKTYQQDTVYVDVNSIQRHSPKPKGETV